MSCFTPYYGRVKKKKPHLNNKFAVNRLLNNALKITASAAETILCLSLSFPATQKHTHIGNTTTTTPIPPSPAPSPLCCAASIIQILSCLFQTAGSSLPPPPSPSLSLSLCVFLSPSLGKEKCGGRKSSLRDKADRTTHRQNTPSCTEQQMWKKTCSAFGFLQEH